MAKQIVWTLGAQQDRLDILTYWKERNQSIKYSKKLYFLFNKVIQLIKKHPKIGRPYGMDEIRVCLAKDYLIVYKEIEDCIVILCIWDSRQDPERLTQRLDTAH